MLIIKNLSSGYYQDKKYHEVIKDINLTVGENEIIGILGPNGSGKTTLLRAIMGEIYSSSGDIIYNGQSIFEKGNYSEFRNNAIYVKQDSFNSLKPLKSINFQIGKLYDWKSFDENYVKSLFSELSLDPAILQMKALQLSDGMRHRVVIAMALLKEPKILMLDEPTTGLDSISTYKLLKILKEIKKKTSIIISSNDVNALFEIADRIYIMYDGMVIEDANFNDLLKCRFHPYTDMILKYVPLYSNKNLVYTPVKNNRHGGCVFINSCPYINNECENDIPYKNINGHGYRCIRYPGWKDDKNN
ncbi:ATP-binding cassette domain-containing protein [Acidiplasma sp.]|uniref:ATP-binding cassette domain-containing protein n=1 Tax=Acidiplasma sp. TaxID=1872114 RepID=UPI0025837A29|nr:ATP-binding cassette domain-containing protein [Acidiplasma sp.]